LINNLTEENIADFKEAFTMFDRDNDGKISYKEMEIIMQNLGKIIMMKQLRRYLKRTLVMIIEQLNFQSFWV